jgi:hypothetical protein
MGALFEGHQMTLPLTATVNPVNSLLFISDLDGGKAPEPIRGAMVLSTPSCISFGTYPEQDGSTEVTLGNMEDVDWRQVPAFQGSLETPNRTVIISTVEREPVLQMRVKNLHTDVKIWLSHPQWPEKVVIGLR